MSVLSLLSSAYVLISFSASVPGPAIPSTTEFPSAAACNLAAGYVANDLSNQGLYGNNQTFCMPKGRISAHPYKLIISSGNHDNKAYFAFADFNDKNTCNDAVTYSLYALSLRNQFLYENSVVCTPEN